MNPWGRLIGLITTTSEASTTAARDLRAITLSYINTDLQAQSGADLDAILQGDLARRAAELQYEHPSGLDEHVRRSVAKATTVISYPSTAVSRLIHLRSRTSAAASASLTSVRSIGPPRIELGHRAPKARVLPVYDGPQRNRANSRMLAQKNAPRLMIAALQIFLAINPASVFSTARVSHSFASTRTSCSRYSRISQPRNISRSSSAAG